MPATQILTQTVKGPYPTLPVAATSLDLVFTAADPVNGNYFTPDPIVSQLSSGTVGGDEIIVFNTDVVPHNITFQSQPDAQGRSGDITNYVVGAGVISYFKMNQFAGWVNLTNQVLITADSALVKIAVVAR